MRYLSLIAALVGWLISAGEIQAYYLDTPHNESNGIYCYTCHEMPEMLNSSIDWAGRASANPDDTLRNLVCNSCHSANPTNVLHKGPVKKLHASSTTTASPRWSTECVQCHDVHFQGQLDWHKDDFSKLYLVTGVFSTANGALTYTDPNPSVTGDDYTSIGFDSGVTLVAQPGFEDKSKWKSKGGATASPSNMDPTHAVDGSRGLILVPDKTNLAETFEIINVTGNVITVKGKMVRDAVNGGAFAITYGQSVKSSIMPTGGNTAGDLRDVKYFVPNIIPASYGGYIDLSPATGTTKPLGLCQVCHTQTDYWRKDGANAPGKQPHNSGTDCKTCHDILTGGSGVVPNSAPEANAGPGQSVTTGGLVILNGSGSTDVDGGPLSYGWSFTSRPVGSNAVLSGANTAYPTFTADVAGVYIVSLGVNDGEVDSAVDSVTVTAVTPNHAPVANAGSDQSVATGRLVTLNGSSSFDADGDPLTYSWSFNALPTGSNAALSGANTVSPSFTVDRPGTYTISLVVNDGKESSTTATVYITATTPLVSYTYDVLNRLTDVVYGDGGHVEYQYDAVGNFVTVVSSSAF